MVYKTKERRKEGDERKEKTMQPFVFILTTLEKKVRNHWHSRRTLKEAWLEWLVFKTPGRYENWR